MEDQEIVGLFFARSEEAVRRLQEKYGRLCRTVAGNILPDERDVEECLQDTSVRLWNSIPPERPEKLGAYVSRVVRNLALDRYAFNRAGKRSSALTAAYEELEDCLSAGSDPEEAALGGDLREVLNDFLRRERPETRVMFVRRYFYGDSIREIAERCGCSEGRVKSALFRTRNRLQAVLLKEGVSL